MDKQAVVITIPVPVTIMVLQTFLDVINSCILDEDDDPFLTVESVQKQPKLLEYICKEAVMDGTAMYDPSEFFNNDGWDELRDYL